MQPSELPDAPPEIVAEAALQTRHDVEIAFGGQRGDLGRGASGDRGDRAQPGAADPDLAPEPGAVVSCHAQRLPRGYSDRKS